MIYLDNGATSFRKPPGVYRAVERAMYTCANPGRGGYPAAMEASETVYACREAAAELFHCRPEQVALTTSCTHGLNIAIRSIVKPGGRVVVSGFEHNAVTRPLHAIPNVTLTVLNTLPFQPERMIEELKTALAQGVDVVICNHVSNVFGCVQPVGEMAALCAEAGAGRAPIRRDPAGADGRTARGVHRHARPQGPVWPTGNGASAVQSSGDAAAARRHGESF